MQGEPRSSGWEGKIQNFKFIIYIYIMYFKFRGEYHTYLIRKLIRLVIHQNLDRSYCMSRKPSIIESTLSILAILFSIYTSSHNTTTSARLQQMHTQAQLLFLYAY